jgi:hypothetical protein
VVVVDAGVVDVSARNGLCRRPVRKELLAARCGVTRATADAGVVTVGAGGRAGTAEAFPERARRTGIATTSTTSRPTTAKNLRDRRSDDMDERELRRLSRFIASG